MKVNDLKIEIKNMKEHCKRNKYCADEQGNVTCRYREMCIDFLKNYELGYTPSVESENTIYKTLVKLSKYEVRKPKQKFTNSKGKYSVRNSKAGYFWRNLQHIYCVRQGKTLKKTWLDFQKFAEYYELMSCDEKYKAKLKKGVEHIDEKAIDWVLDK